MYVLARRDYGYGREPDDFVFYGYTDDTVVVDAWTALGSRYRAEWVSRVTRENGLFKIAEVEQNDHT